MKTAFFISARKDTDGGGYTLLKDLFDEIIKRKEFFFFIIWDKGNDYFKKQLKKKKIRFVEIKDSKLKVLLCNLFPIINPLVSYPLRKILNLNNIKKIVYLSSEYFYPLDKKYIATVWDIQHMTNPYFRETGSPLVKIFRSIVVNKFIKNANKVIVGTKIGSLELQKYLNIKKNKFIYIPHPTPTDCLKKRGKSYLKNFFIYPANYWEHKNHTYLINTFEKLVKKFNFKKKLILVGAIKNFQFFNVLKKKILYKKLNNHIILKTFVKRKSLLKYYDDCEALIYPSTSGPENLPPLEAMARGKNVIVSNYPGAKEQYKNAATYFDLNKNNSLSNILLKKNYFKPRKKLIKYAKSKNVKFYINTLFKNI